MEDHMFGTLRTLIAGQNARAEENLREVYSIELIDQKIREAQAGLKAAKATLASLMQRQCAESRQIDTLDTRCKDLLVRTEEALETLERLDARVLQLRTSVEKTHRRIIDLRQGAISARAVRHEQDVQTRLNRSIGATSPINEAEELIANVLKRDDPFEQGLILEEIDKGLNHENIADRMAAEGIGKGTKTTANDVLERLKAKK
jgi:phage shock protein A